MSIGGVNDAVADDAGVDDIRSHLPVDIDVCAGIGAGVVVVGRVDVGVDVGVEVCTVDAVMVAFAGFASPAEAAFLVVIFDGKTLVRTSRWGLLECP